MKKVLSWYNKLPKKGKYPCKKNFSGYCDEINTNIKFYLHEVDENGKLKLSKSELIKMIRFWDHYSITHLYRETLESFILEQGLDVEEILHKSSFYKTRDKLKKIIDKMENGERYKNNLEREDLAVCLCCKDERYEPFLRDVQRGLA